MIAVTLMHLAGFSIMWVLLETHHDLQERIKRRRRVGLWSMALVLTQVGAIIIATALINVP